MNEAIVKQQLQVLKAQVELFRAQIDTLEHALIEPKTPTPPTAQIERPERCAGIPEDACGLCDDEARISRASFADPTMWMCRGCRVTVSELKTEGTE